MANQSPLDLSHSPLPAPAGMEITGRTAPELLHLLPEGALKLLAKLEREFGGRRRQLLQARVERQKEIDSGRRPDFLASTKLIRDSEWTTAPIPKDLIDRRVEITGPTDRKMVINALNSGANVFMADFEDSNSPTWDNLVRGQANLRDAVRKSITYAGPAAADGSPGKQYKLKDKTATLMVRPRGWHLEERHVKVDGKPMSGSLFDFGLFLFHNAKELLDRGSGPYFYLPKMESHLEARLWNEVFNMAQDELRIPRGTIRATALLETILASFEIEEILYELRSHSAGLNCGRWDYIFSAIKKFGRFPEFCLPDRSEVTMTSPFLRAYSLLLIKSCHKRGAHAMGGMAAQIPIKNDPAANEQAMAKVRADKEREAGDGHDGTWVAHPDLVPVAKEIFDRKMPTPNQIHVKREDVKVSAADLIEMPKGAPTEKGVRANINIAIQYLESWLRGVGCVPIFNLMEDAATAEISRAQIWQWLRHGVTLADGRKLTKELYAAFVPEELEKIRALVGDKKFAEGKFTVARSLFDDLVMQNEFAEFLTLKAYENLEAP
ncbi:MAG: malate synthase [Fibrobacteres bacterium]|nr:malate synthase [Fibrobacterota bacterium]